MSFAFCLQPITSGWLGERGVRWDWVRGKGEKGGKGERGENGGKGGMGGKEGKG